MHGDGERPASYGWAPDSVTQSLELHHSSPRLDLRDPIDGRLVGRLTGVERREGVAHTADGDYGLLVERQRGGWQVAARRSDDQVAIGAYYAGWRPGGRIWIAPEHWGRLRWHPLRRRWTLTTPAGEVMRLERRAVGPHQIVVAAGAPEPIALLALLIAWVVVLETDMAPALTVAEWESSSCSTSTSGLLTAGAPSFTVASAASGHVFASDVSIESAAGWMQPYEAGAEHLSSLEVSEVWCSSDAADGISITRVR